MAVKQMIEASMKESADIRRKRLLHVSTSTLQIMDTGRFTQVTPRSATAKERMNQFVVVCNLLLLKNNPAVSQQTEESEKPTYDPKPA